ncbi:MAG: DUF5654 family protein [Candidatus Methanoplasma sp.]|nr:DUF5654 family protein [Candidatus Methanoplasma sp.]
MEGKSGSTLESESAQEMDDETKLQFVTTFSSLITAAFGLVAALAWNDTIKEAISKIFTDGDTLLGSLVYAIIVTILAVAMTVWISKNAKKLSDRIKFKENKE